MEDINKIFNEDCLFTMARMKEGMCDISITSPPYNMRNRIYKGQYRKDTQKSNTFNIKYKYFNDDLTIDEYYNFHKQVLTELLRVSKIIFYNISIVTGSKEAIFKLMGDFSKNLKDIIVWDKGFGQPAMHSGVMNRGYELILIFEKNAEPGRCFKTSYFKRGEMSDIWRIGRGKSSKEHGACFPEILVEKVLEGWSKKNDIIYDPFAGSGTTLVVAKRMDRNYIGSEIVEDYCKIIENKLNLIK